MTTSYAACTANTFAVPRSCKTERSKAIVPCARGFVVTLPEVAEEDAETEVEVVLVVGEAMFGGPEINSKTKTVSTA